MLYTSQVVVWDFFHQQYGELSWGVVRMLFVGYVTFQWVSTRLKEYLLETISQMLYV